MLLHLRMEYYLLFNIYTDTKKMQINAFLFVCVCAVDVQCDDYVRLIIPW